MKRNLIYITLLLLLIVAIILIHRSKKEATKIQTDQDFSVTDVETVDRIVLTDNKNSADLKKAGNHWMINGKYRAMQAKVDVLLETIKKVSVYSPVSNLRLESVMREIEMKSTKVALYHGGEDTPFKIYYVGGNTDDSKGTYMVMELYGKRAEKPYVMHIPGFTGILDVRYFTDEIEWRDTNIFDYSADDIKEVTVQYLQQPDSSFSIKVLGTDSFAVYPVKNIPNPKPAEKIYKEGVVKYLSSFKFLNAESFNNQDRVKDSIAHTVPYATVTVKDNSGTRQMVVYHMPLNKRSKLQFDERGNQLPYDLDKYYATINDGKDFVIIQDFVFGKVLRKYSDFLLKK